MPVILQVNYTPSDKQSRQAPQDRIESAKAIAKLPGLLWKVWIEDSVSNTRGGIYLFENLDSAKAWGDGVLATRLAEGGGSDVSIRYFDVNEEPSVITRAPLAQLLQAA
ncbi:YdhR family protein [Vineibacter terrae]|uniref:YdhR family protein n=1 Tax=Vineibacter terrae TaxID=2586908 RepID=UPI002E327132|nr:YdhR family protein [Vineibacter terrae]HEX2886560.1 YdhR family protein [Vineibacter terrae]